MTLAPMIQAVLDDCTPEELKDGTVSETLGAVIQEQILDQIARRENELLVTDGTNLGAASVVGASTGNPGVQLEVEGKIVLVTAEVALEWANNIMAAAYTATHDASVLRWFQIGEIGMDKDTAQRTLAALRNFRGDTAERKRPT